MLHPAKDGSVGYINAAFAHHGYQVSIAQFVGDVPADIQHDNFLGKSSSTGTNCGIPTMMPDPDSILHQNHPEMVEGRSIGGWGVVGDGGRDSARGGDLAAFS